MNINKYWNNYDKTNKNKSFRIDLEVKESMLIRKCLNNYMLENNLEYDKSPLFNDLMHKIKEFEEELSRGIALENAKSLINKHKTKRFDALSNIVKNDSRDYVNEQLKRYDIQSICNKKILTLDKEELQESKINNSQVSKLCNELIINKRNK